MPQTVSDHIIQRLYAWGVRTIFGYPGDGINGLIGALDLAVGNPAVIGEYQTMQLHATLPSR